MTMPISLLALAVDVPAPSGFWPASISGWLTMVISVGTLVSGFVAYGKWLNRMNGFGERLKLVEDEQNRTKGAEVERIRQFDAVMHEQRTILASIARAETATEACREELGQHALSIGSQVAQAMTRMNGMEVNLSQRLSAVETALKLRGNRHESS